MKKNLLLLAISLATFATLCAQNIARTSPHAETPIYNTNTVNSTWIGRSSINTAYAISEQRQLSTLNTVGTNGGSVAFIFRQNWQNCGSAAVETGVLRYNLSTNGGQNWLTYMNPCIGQGPLNPLFTYPADYCNGHLFAANGGTTTNDLNLAYTASISYANGGGIMFGASNDLTNPIGPAVNMEDYAVFAPIVSYNYSNIAERNAGEFWSAAIKNATDLEIWKGNWDNTTYTISWGLHQSINMSTYLNNVAGNTTSYNPTISFSQDGQKGFLVMSGDLIGGWDSCVNAVICEYNLASGQFDAPYEMSFNDFPAVPLYISQTANALGLPFCNKASIINPHITVDSRGELHIHALAEPANMNVSFATDLYDMTKDAQGNWGLIHTAKISLPNGSLGIAPNNTNYKTFSSISRSADGKYILYSWEDTDTTGGNITPLPNLKGRIYDVLADKISPIIDWTTNDISWAGKAKMPKTAEIVLETSTCNFTVPTVVIEELFPSGPNFHYFSNINYSCAQATDTTQWLKSCAATPISLNPIITPTACVPNANNGSINFNVTGGFSTPYTYFIHNVLTNITDTLSSPIVPNLSAGLYDIWVTDAGGCQSNFQSISLNQGNAANVSATTNNLMCAGTSTCITLSQSSSNCTYSWNTGATSSSLCNVGAGNYWVNVNCGGCSAFAAASITQPAPIMISSTQTNLYCSGDSTASISVNVTGGNPPYLYQWTGNSNATTEDLIHLTSGTYTLLVTDVNGCQMSSNPITITSPAPLNTQLSNVGVYMVASVQGGAPPYAYSWAGPACFNNSPNYTGAAPCLLCGGTYTVYVMDWNNCLDTVSAAGCLVSIEKEIGLSAFELSPNPTTESADLYISFDKAENVRMSCSNLHGQIIWKKDFPNSLIINEKMQVKDWAKGIYYLQIATNEGMISRKLVVE